MTNKAIIVDDELDCINSLKHHLVNHKDTISVVGEADNIHEAKLLIENLNPDVIFLDIHIGPHLGFELLEELSSIDFQVIFVTAHDEYAIRAFEYNAIDYLLKPLSDNDVARVVKKLIQQEKTISDEALKLFVQHFKSDKVFEKIAIPTEEGTFFVKVEDIIRCEAARGYTTIFINGDRKILTSKSLREYEDMLTNSLFFRVHKSHLINKEYIERYKKSSSGGEIKMTDGEKIEIARRRKDEFNTFIGG